MEFIVTFTIIVALLGIEKLSLAIQKARMARRIKIVSRSGEIKSA